MYRREDLKKITENIRYCSFNKKDCTMMAYEKSKCHRQGAIGWQLKYHVILSLKYVAIVA